uniref:uncharacterized protein isoform X3 n=1 Tax=Pristiophorus japonicus TaxID=55135 RepID=UPI00398F36AF
MFEDMFDDFMEMTSDFYSTWWASPPPPPESFFHYLFGIGFFETVTFLRSTYMGIITLVMLCLLFVSFLMQIMVVCMYLIYWWKEWKQKHSMASLKPAISDSPHSTCHQCHFCKELKNPKMTQTNWKHAIPESTDTEQEVDKDNHMPIQKWRHGFYCMKKPESPRSTRETSHSRRHDERSSRSSTPHSPGCQQDFSQEDSPFTTNEDYEEEIGSQHKGKNTIRRRPAKSAPTDTLGTEGRCHDESCLEKGNQ